MTPVLDDVELHRLIAVPRLDDPAAVSDRESFDRRPPPDGGITPVHLFAAVTAAHSQLGDGGLLAMAWDRLGGSAVRVLVGGRPSLPAAHPGLDTGDGRYPLLYPPGSVAVPASRDDVLAQWDRLPTWTRCVGATDSLWSGASEDDGRPPRRGGFDDYIAHLPGEFVWLVLATPRDEDLTERELLGLQSRLPRLRQLENSEADRTELLRAEHRYRELSRARTSGMWSVRVFIGAADPPSCRRAAALLTSASDLDGLPYVLTPSRVYGSFGEVAAGDAGEAFSASGELVAALARPPRRELPGLRMVEPASFDVTPERSGSIHLGGILDDADRAVGELGVGLDTLVRHTFVAGATGSGKSQTTRHLLEGLHRAGVPWLVIEPAKAEYAAMAGRLGEPVTVIRPGDPNACPVGINPLEPEPGFPLQTHLDLTRALFLAAFDVQEPFPQVLAHTLARSYADLGWDPVTGDAELAEGRPKYPSLGDVQRIAKLVVDDIGYGRDVRDNIRGVVDVRIGSLRLGTPGRFFEGGYPLDVPALLRRNVVLEIEDLGSDTDKAFFIGAVVIRLFEHLRLHPRPGLGHVIVLEEAHRLLKNAAPGSVTAHAVELFTALLAEIRAYGAGFVVAEQIPTKIVPDVVKNTACKILHRLPAADDREVVGASMNLNAAQSRHVVALPPGRGVVFTDGMDRPMRVAVPFHDDSATHRPRTAPVAGPRSEACADCVEAPCTLREVSRASRFSGDPQLTLWIELLTIAHVIGLAAPVPKAAWATELAARAGGARPLECAVTHAVDRAVDARYIGLSRHYRPETLAVHLAAAARRALAEPGTRCRPRETRWQAGQFRWRDVYNALRQRPDVDDVPHPRTASWRRRGLLLPGNTRAEQLAALRARPDVWRADRTTKLGDGTVARVVSELSRERDPDRALRCAADFLDGGSVRASMLALTSRPETRP